MPTQIHGRLATRSQPAGVRADYRRSVEYTLASLISYVEHFGDDRLVLVFLGDHQPAPVVVGPNASKDVPITTLFQFPTIATLAAHLGQGAKAGPANAQAQARRDLSRTQMQERMRQLGGMRRR